MNKWRNNLLVKRYSDPRANSFYYGVFHRHFSIFNYIGNRCDNIDKNRSLIAIFLFISAVLIGLFSMNIIAMILWLIVIVLLIVKRNQYKNDSDWHAEQYKHAEKKENPYIY